MIESERASTKEVDILMTTAHKFKVFQKGFSLIELMIAIVIIAVLASVGFVVYGNLQSGARNAARKEDIDAIANALEFNKNATTGQYTNFTNAQFANGAPPSGSPVYCFIASNTTANPTAAWTTACPTGWSIVSTSVGAGSTFKVCAWLEAEGSTAATAFCRGSQQ